MRAPWALVIVPALVIGLAACESSQPARPVSSPGVAAYVHCLAQDSSGGAAKACRSLRPTGGLAQVLSAVTNCLTAHGISVPAASPGTRGKALSQFLAGLRTGSPAQQSAFQSCVTRAGHS